MPLLVWQIFYSGELCMPLCFAIRDVAKRVASKMLNSIVNQNVEIQNIFNLVLTLNESHV